MQAGEFNRGQLRDYFATPGEMDELRNFGQATFSRYEEPPKVGEKVVVYEMSPREREVDRVSASLRRHIAEVTRVVGPFPGGKFDIILADRQREGTLTSETSQKDKENGTSHQSPLFSAFHVSEEEAYLFMDRDSTEQMISSNFSFLTETKQGTIIFYLLSSSANGAGRRKEALKLYDQYTQQAHALILNPKLTIPLHFKREVIEELRKNHKPSSSPDLAIAS